MLNHMIQINLLYNNWIWLILLFSVLIFIYFLAKNYFIKKVSSPDQEMLRQINRELIKVDEDLRTLKENHHYKK